MALTVDQQSLAVLTYAKQQLCLHPKSRGYLQEPFFLANLDHHFPALYRTYSKLYGARPDCLDSLVSLVGAAAQSWNARPEELKDVDKRRLMRSDGHKSNKQLGGLCCLGSYANDLVELGSRIDYFKELGLTYLHVVRSPSKGSPTLGKGYNNEDDAAGLGCSHDLQKLATDLHDTGIRLAIDFDLIHAPQSQVWESLADNGDLEASSLFWLFQDRNVAAEFASPAQEGDIRSLSYGRWACCSADGKYDLNYSNPSVLLAMSSEILTLANYGVDIFNMRNISSIWKRMGTTSYDLPECKQILQIFNTVCRIAAPSILFQTDSNGVGYASRDGCHLSANKLQMSLSWDALATRNVQMLQLALEKDHNLADGHWVNYVRTTEDLRFDFPNSFPYSCSINANDHRQFLQAFYTNQFPGAFARGISSQAGSVSGTTSSLVGLESGEDGAVERLLLMYSVAFSTGGIATINLGDEVGVLNDYAVLEHSHKESDNSLIQRSRYSEDSYKDRRDPSTTAGRIYDGIRHLSSLRRNAEELSGGKLVGFHTHNNHVLGYQRFGDKSRLLCLANFSDTVQQLDPARFTMSSAVDLYSRKHVNLAEGIELDANQFMWLRIGYGTDVARPSGTKRYSFRNSPLPSPTGIPCDIDTTLHE